MTRGSGSFIARRYLQQVNDEAYLIQLIEIYRNNGDEAEADLLQIELEKVRKAREYIKGGERCCW